jgi:hypothetical protein
MKSERKETLIRSHYAEQGYEVRIGRDGHVTYRKGDGPWLEGRYISEYEIISGDRGADVRLR